MNDSPACRRHGVIHSCVFGRPYRERSSSAYARRNGILSLIRIALSRSDIRRPPAYKTQSLRSRVTFSFLFCNCFCVSVSEINRRCAGGVKGHARSISQPSPFEVFNFDFPIHIMSKEWAFDFGALLSLICILVRLRQNVSAGSLRIHQAQA